MQEVVLFIPALIVLLLFSAFFSGSEAALFSLSRHQVRRMREERRGRVVADLLDRPRNLLVSILLGNLLVNIFATSTVTALLIRLYGENGVWYAFIVMSVLLMAFGEIFPKVIALHWAERVAKVMAYPLRVFHVVMLPLRYPLSIISNAIIDYLRGHLGQAKKSFTWEELLTALRIGRGQGAFGVFEYEILSNVVAFRQKLGREVMTPSINVIAVSVTSTRAQLVDQFSRSGHSRIPVYGETTDDVIGILHIKDLVDPAAASNEKAIREILHDPHFVQENTPISKIYNELQERKQHVAVVLDEYASFAGLITVEDILEELVGEIRDVRDSKKEPYMRLGDDRIVVQGEMELDEFNIIFDTQLEDEQHNTIAGYVLGLIGRIPDEGETFQSDDDGLKFHIVAAQPNKIRKMRVERI